MISFFPLRKWINLHTFPEAIGGRCGCCCASKEDFPLRWVPAEVCCIGPEICLGALIAGRLPFLLLVLRDFPLLSDILETSCGIKNGNSLWCELLHKPSC